MASHKLNPTSISDAGHVDLEVQCPAWPFDKERCPALAELRHDPPPDGTPCLLAYEYGLAGPTIVAGRASGSGPWRVVLDYVQPDDPEAEPTARFTLVDDAPAPTPAAAAEAKPGRKKATAKTGGRKTTARKGRK